ncbi:carbohydrate esterase family 16 protein [Botryobasidium botryosum FD-172 SS1]|uniref:Carbohydrate esterase family 16 protein n=1 Tax=Botryobasidium botryosum (strain FD-172 SS1) TaxID=930990 RepID=A0A067M1X8_BOTB1|nr:carbohydrate esterase family 16 protein [Botryobasidium botryosum FD-172 SS1]
MFNNLITTATLTEVDADEDQVNVYVGPHWPGFASLRYLFVFGDSYSDVGYNSDLCTPPSDENPLGVVFPGQTYAEDDAPNWVGYLATEFNKSRFLVYDYAVGGAVTRHLRFEQVEREFLKGAGSRDSDSKAARPKWNAGNSLFVSWIGINDLGRGWSSAAALDLLFEAQEMLFEAGARNFLFIDIPPINRSPAASLARAASVDPLYKSHNTQLSSRIARFVKSHPEISAFQFYAYDMFNQMLDNPEMYGFNPKDVRKAGGSVWVDHLHPTSAVHKVIAENVASFLYEIEGKSQPEAQFSKS